MLLKNIIHGLYYLATHGVLLKNKYYLFHIPRHTIILAYLYKCYSKAGGYIMSVLQFVLQSVLICVTNICYNVCNNLCNNLSYNVSYNESYNVLRYVHCIQFISH